MNAQYVPNNGTGMKNIQMKRYGALSRSLLFHGELVTKGRVMWEIEAEHGGE